MSNLYVNPQTNTEQKSPRLSTVVVGAGAVGLLLAHELIKRGEKVILLDSAGDEVSSFERDEYQISGLPHQGTAIGRMKGLGGTTSVWGGQLAEFVEPDLQREDYDQPPWPIKWNELSRYYPRVYQKLFVGALGYGQAEPMLLTDDGDGLELFFTRWLKQPNFARHFLDDIASSDFATILSSTTVTNLTFDGGRCININVHRKGVSETLEGFDRIVIAAGTIETNRLLLIAAANPGCPFAGNHWLGKYFQDHIGLTIGRIDNPSPELIKRFSNQVHDGEKLQPKLRMRGSAGAPYLGISGIFSFDNKSSEHLQVLKQFAKAVTGNAQQRHGLRGWASMITRMLWAIPHCAPLIYSYVRHNRIYVPLSSAVSLNLQAQQISTPESAISLNNEEVDELGRPKAVIDWRIDGREIAHITRFAEVLDAYLVDHRLGKLVWKEWLSNEKNEASGAWKAMVHDTFHQAGGAIMSRSGDHGVVDANLRVHGTDNLFVAGAAVFPTSSYANTTLTALALTLRLADYLTEDEECAQ